MFGSCSLACSISLHVKDDPFGYDFLIRIAHCKKDRISRFLIAFSFSRQLIVRGFDTITSQIVHSPLYGGITESDWNWVPNSEILDLCNGLSAGVIRDVTHWRPVIFASVIDDETTARHNKLSLIGPRKGDPDVLISSWGIGPANRLQCPQIRAELHREPRAVGIHIQV
jgi:hypothetical protein